MQQPEKTQLAIYLRLSAADGADAESNSIANQRTFLYQWAGREGYQITEEFQDDGHTGTDFDRPGFQSLMQKLQSGAIKTFATTDLSRLGRNYLEVGILQEQTFPLLGVRYIAVNDGYDSAQPAGGSIDPTIFKNLMNDVYAKDCSSKVVRSKRTLQRAGKYLGGAAPYGYRIDPDNKYHIVPDADTAPVVQRIYRSFLAGETRTYIAKCLTREGIPTPAAEKKMTGRPFTGVWNATTLKRILSMPTYYGAVTQHTSEMISYKVHRAKKVAVSQWIVVPGTHEGLVSREDFDAAQQMLQSRSYTAAGRQEHLLTGITYCAECGAKMYAHLIGGHFYMTCYNYSRNPGLHLCTGHYIREDALLDAVREQLCAAAASAADIDQMAQQKIDAQHKAGPAQREENRIRARLKKIQLTRVSAYQDKANELLTETEFREIADSLRQEENALASRLDAILGQKPQLMDLETAKTRIRQLLRFEHLYKAQLHRLIRRIEVDENKNITISFAFSATAGKNSGGKF
ncbi:MAG: recombinase family protein [Faecalibacterium sp.]|jgi:DNA invertase Pin-like site-specific DNA recombinase|nr:recombinase family protein [Faecalibacterium sp.]